MIISQQQMQKIISQTQIGQPSNIVNILNTTVKSPNSNAKQIIHEATSVLTSKRNRPPNPDQRL